MGRLDLALGAALRRSRRVRCKLMAERADFGRCKPFSRRQAVWISSAL